MADTTLILRAASFAAHKHRDQRRKDAAGSPYINQQAPSAGCGAGAYVMPAIYNPWSLGEATDELRHNSPGDGVAPLKSIVLTRAAHTAMGWPLDENRTFDGNLLGFNRGTGVFLKNAEPGFKGFDFQARLVWENVYAPCTDLAGGDFVSTLVANAGSATLRDVVVALKDRLVNETSIDEPSGEAAAIEALYGAALTDPASGVVDLEGSTRRLCGALLSSPQFLMSGIVDPTVAEVPALNPAP